MGIDTMENWLRSVLTVPSLTADQSVTQYRLKVRKGGRYGVYLRHRDLPEQFVQSLLRERCWTLETGPLINEQSPSSLPN